MMQQPSLYIGSIRIDEPITALTDVLVGLACLYYAFRLKKLARGKAIHQLIYLYFFLMGIATLSGGILGHAFTYAIGLAWKLPGWLLSMVAINLFERVMIQFSAHILSPKAHRILSIFNIIELVFFMALAFGFLNFLFVQIHSTYGFLVVIFSFCVYNYRHHYHRDIMIDMMKGVFYIFLCAVVFVAKIQISIWFNHADFAHVLMLVGAYYFYSGSKKIMERT